MTAAQCSWTKPRLILKAQCCLFDMKTLLPGVGSWGPLIANMGALPTRRVRVFCFGCLKGLSKSVQVLCSGIEALMVLTLIVLKLVSPESGVSVVHKRKVFPSL